MKFIMAVLQIVVEQALRKNQFCDSPFAYQHKNISNRKFQISLPILVKFGIEGLHIMQLISCVFHENRHNESRTLILSVKE
jgi:hypothetical protein